MPPEAIRLLIHGVQHLPGVVVGAVLGVLLLGKTAVPAGCSLLTNGYSWTLGYYCPRPSPTIGLNSYDSFGFGSGWLVIIGLGIVGYAVWQAIFKRTSLFTE